MRSPGSEIHDWHASNVSELVAALDSSPVGLSAPEAAARLEQYGPNHLPEKPADQVSPKEIESAHLVLFGDPDSNSLLRKVLPELKGARFYQLENKIDAKGDAELAFFVPLVE